MATAYTSDSLRNLFQSSFNLAQWYGFLQHFFNATELKSTPEKIIGNTSDAGYYLGNIDTIDSYHIGFFQYNISRGSVANKRVGLRNLVKSFINPIWGEFDAALVVFDSGDHWRLSFICDIKDEATSPKRYTYVFGSDDLLYRTPIERFNFLKKKGVSFETLKAAFSVEALSDEFFDKYREQYADFIQYITGKRFVKVGSKWEEKMLGEPNVALMQAFNYNEKKIRDYVKKMMGRITFLHFLQRKGWMCGDLNYMHNMFENSAYKNDYLDSVLEPLFFGILNTKPTEREILFTKYGWDKSLLAEWKDIPYLNGGLFERDEEDEPKSRFPAEYFKRLFQFFSEYNFTIDENDPNDAEVGVDPEMLGKIFENLLEDNKDKGAFYTPKEIVRYMCQESLIAYLETNTSIAKDKIRQFVLSPEEGVKDIPENKKPKLLTALKEVKICDPAIGSGAFPMGLLNELLHCREVLSGDHYDRAEIKKSIIQNNIYGVDIEKGAVDIARLRFWLSIVVDEETPSPLPNLDYKIMQGNSLIESFMGVDLSKLTYEKEYKEDKGEISLFDDEKNRLQKTVSHLLSSYYSCSDHDRKVTLQQEISDTINKQLEAQAYDPAILDKLKTINLAENNNFFLWHTWFSDVFNRDDKEGFDIVIGNPPYVSAVNMARTGEEKLLYKQSYPEATGAYDMYVLFLLLGVKLSSNIYCWIIPNKLLVADYAKKTLHKLKAECGLEKTIDVSVYDVFKNASVYPIIVLGNKVSHEQFNSYFLNNYTDLIDNRLNKKESVEESNKVRLSLLGLKVCSGATGFEAQKIKENICEIDNNHTIPFTVSGNIDRYVFNNTNVRYMKDKYSRAFIYLDSNITESKQEMWKNPKIIIAGMTKKIEACYVDTPLAIGVGVYAIYDFAGYNPFYILGILNSKSTTDFLTAEFSDKHLAGGYLAINKSTIEQFLFPKNVPADVQQHIADIAKSIHLAKKENPKSDIATLESQIDSIVSHLHSI
ncbi:Eco57I restriction-modification methylase domain-containing protein [Alistipes putredinis]|jgi:type IIS restriction endonuclease|uniref:Eco57I restriction-modification methylase domain-containing protein n=1 Tax=Alistipes putredinis TaxID=28117 RepID=UPI001D06D028|nr:MULTISPECIES: Eco57I restriction-modification methylase domain-containing protein [Bacteroidales]MCB7350268.1 Eco57I restriction-modification methylase domain-containing protein [Alistipes putredinis]MCG4721181.1 Eco57I restriction-modification methylase domain-containing protein [Alistipes putredinis]MCQ5065264.1 Eco57I restriction-modification methylase domain-containing protein [Alistipes putredinis]MCQ5076112.1 Eco57I restriction-modification methylase domain-containing protein [Alistipe